MEAGFAQPQIAAPAGRDWILRVSADGRDVQLAGASMVSEGSLAGFVAGRLLSSTGSATVTTQSLLNDFSRSPDDAVKGLRGSFVVAIQDRAAGTMRIVRDQVGAHPLFRAVTADGIFFAETIETLLLQPGVSRTLNRVAMADHLCKRWPDREETFFSQVKRVPAGWQAVIGPGGLTMSRYWSPSGAEIEWLPDREVERFDDLLEQAVARSISGGRPGIFLSGGFDSVSIAAVAADLARRTSGHPPAALSLAFPDPTCDEQLIQSSVAKSLDLPLHLAPFARAAGPRGLLAHGLALNTELAAPLFNSWMPAYLSLVNHAREHGIDTILTGEGGDEWLGTSPFLAADLMRRLDVAGLVRLVRTQKRSYRQGWDTAVRGTLWTFGLRPILGMAAHRIAPKQWDDRRADKVMMATPSWIRPDRELYDQQRERARASLAAANPDGGFYSRESRLFLDHPLNSWLFEEQHAIGRRRGVRYAHPYWDADLVAHVYRIRPERLNREYRRKALVRQTVARRFPTLGFERQRKVAALDFFASILRAEGPRLAEAVSDFSGLASAGVVEPAAARDFVRDAWSRTPREMGVAWNLVNAESWVRTHFQ